MTADGTNLLPHRAVSFISVIFWPRLSYCSNFVSFISENDIITWPTPAPTSTPCCWIPHGLGPFIFGQATVLSVLPAQAMGGGTSLLVLGQDGCAQGWVTGWSGLQAGNVVIALHTPVFAAFI
jgi:hypothetical protein